MPADGNTALAPYRRARKALAEANLIADQRCREALEFLESKRLDDGGFAAEEKYYHLADRRMKSGRRLAGRSLVNWGGVNKRRMNEWVYE